MITVNVTFKTTSTIKYTEQKHIGDTRSAIQPNQKQQYSNLAYDNKV